MIENRSRGGRWGDDVRPQYLLPLRSRNGTPRKKMAVKQIEMYFAPYFVFLFAPLAILLARPSLSQILGSWGENGRTFYLSRDAEAESRVWLL